MRFRIWLENETDLWYLLGPPGKIPQIGPEKSTPAHTIHTGIMTYVSPHGSYRYVFYIADQPVSALQVVTRDGKHGHTANAFTLPEFRRMGYARKLLDQARKDFKTITHSSHQSELGKLWVTGTS